MLCHCEVFSRCAVKRVNVMCSVPILTVVVVVLLQTLLQWWAQFCESNGDFPTAVRYYNHAEDALSLVRLYCFNNEFGTVRATLHYFSRLCARGSVVFLSQL